VKQALMFHPCSFKEFFIPLYACKQSAIRHNGICFSLFQTLFVGVTLFSCGPASVVGIATSYGLDGPGIESRWDRDFPHLSRPALRPTQPPVQWVKVKVKQSRYKPGVAQRVPGVLGSQISWHSAHEGGEVVNLTHRPPIPPGNVPGTHFH
jgi:hypothetical protein